VLIFLVVLIVLGGYGLYAMKPAERERLFRAARARVEQWKDAAVKRRSEPEPFRDALRERTRWAIVTPALAALSVWVFAGMLFGSGALSDPHTLLSWGGSLGPRTTNGEWWRLVTSMFVHAGMLQLLVNTAALVQLGVMLERLVGPWAFAAVYLTAGTFANLLGLSSHPVEVRFGGSGAVFGVYGLLIASLVWGPFRRSAASIPLRTLKRLVPVTAVFVLYNAWNDNPDGASELVGLTAGLVCGLVLAMRVSERKPTLRRVAATSLATAIIAIVSAVPLRGIADVRPEIARVVAMEERVAGTYEKAVGQFRNGRMSADELANEIEHKILPEIEETYARLKALRGVPREHQPLVASAEDYLRLRETSWLLRAEGLHKTSMRTLSKADSTERASWAALQKIKPAD
jgi:rhomboid protease GluP